LRINFATWALTVVLSMVSHRANLFVFERPQRATKHFFFTVGEIDTSRREDAGRRRRDTLNETCSEHVVAPHGSLIDHVDRHDGTLGVGGFIT